MEEVLWLSKADVARTGVCRMEDAQAIVEQVFGLFDRQQACIVPESSLRLDGEGVDQACYALPAYVGGGSDVCGLKWTAHGAAVAPSDSGASRIQATLLIHPAHSGVPLALMNGTDIGAARTGAVTALALSRLAPLNTRKVALCGAGGQAERQLQAILHALPQAEEVAIWSRGGERNRVLAGRYQDQAGGRLRPVDTLEEAACGADVLIAATSAPQPYLLPEHLRSVALYCHIGFHEIFPQAVDRFSHVVVDTWDEAKDVSGQSLFRYYREGRFDPARLTGTLGAILTGRLQVPRGTAGQKIMFDAFGLPIFDLALAKEAYVRASRLGLGVRLPW